MRFNIWQTNKMCLEQKFGCAVQRLDLRTSSHCPFYIILYPAFNLFLLYSPTQSSEYKETITLLLSFHPDFIKIYNGFIDIQEMAQ